MLITPQQLNTVATNINSQRAEVMAGLLNELCQKYGITDTTPFQMFLANVIQESGEFAHKQENMPAILKNLLIWFMLTGWATATPLPVMAGSLKAAGLSVLREELCTHNMQSSSGWMLKLLRTLLEMMTGLRWIQPVGFSLFLKS
jgi:predicted chitinase